MGNRSRSRPPTSNANVPDDDERQDAPAIESDRKSTNVPDSAVKGSRSTQWPPTLNIDVLVIVKGETYRYQFSQIGEVPTSHISYLRSQATRGSYGCHPAPTNPHGSNFGPPCVGWMSEEHHHHRCSPPPPPTAPQHQRTDGGSCHHLEIATPSDLPSATF